MIGTIAVALVRSQLVIPHLYGSTWWAITWDAWAGTDSAAHLVAGHPFLAYEGPKPFVYMPLYAVVMVPPYLVARGLGLLMDHPVGPFHPRPSAWPVLLGWGAASSIVLYAAASRLARRVRVPSWTLIASGAACVAWPTLTWGHFEDLIIVGLITWSAVLVADGDRASDRDWTGAALLLGVAGGIKQTAWLFIPLLVMWAPPRLRTRTAVVAVSVPAVLVAAILIAASDAPRALFPRPVWSAVGAAAPWVAVPKLPLVGSEALPVETSTRLFAVPVALASCFMVWRRRSLAAWLAGAVVVGAGRALCEAVQWPYYAAALFWFTACLLVLRRAWVAVVLVGVYSVAISELYPPPLFLEALLSKQSTWWWVLESMVIVLCVAVALRDLWRARDAAGVAALP